MVPPTGRGTPWPTWPPLAEEGTFITTIHRVFPLAEGAEAHRLSQQGHVRGKVILTVP